MILFPILILSRAIIFVNDCRSFYTRHASLLQLVKLCLKLRLSQLPILGKFFLYLFLVLFPHLQTRSMPSSMLFLTLSRLEFSSRGSLESLARFPCSSRTLCVSGCHSAAFDI